jgi:hypothetical protein
MASFVTAFFAGGLELIAILIVVVVVERAKHASDYEVADREGAAWGGAMVLGCADVIAIPTALVGLGLAVVGLFAQRNRNQLFTWIGALGNATVILAAVGLYVLGAVADSWTHPPQTPPPQTPQLHFAPPPPCARVQR